MDNRKAILPGISNGGAVKPFEELRGNLRAGEKIPHTLSDLDAEVALVDVGPLKKCAKVFRCLGKKADSLHDFRHGSGMVNLNNAAGRVKAS
jgi:hypothetical protein